MSTSFTTRAFKCKSQLQDAKNKLPQTKIPDSFANLEFLKKERKTRLEPATPTLARSCSTTELHPHPKALAATWADNGAKLCQMRTVNATGRIRPIARRITLNPQLRQAYSSIFMFLLEPAAAALPARGLGRPAPLVGLIGRIIGIWFEKKSPRRHPLAW